MGEGLRLNARDPPESVPRSIRGTGGSLWEIYPTRVCELVVGLGDVEVVGIADVGLPQRVHIRGRVPRPDGGIVTGHCGLSVRSEWSWWTSRRSGDQPARVV